MIGPALPGLVPLAIVAVLWARWLVRRKGERAGRWRWVPWIAGAIPIATLGVTVAMLTRASWATTAVDAAEKQAALASSVQAALTATGLGYVAIGIVLAALAAGTVHASLVGRSASADGGG